MFHLYQGKVPAIIYVYFFLLVTYSNKNLFFIIYKHEFQNG